MKRTWWTLGVMAFAVSQSACRLDVGTQVGRHEFRQSIALGPASHDSNPSGHRSRSLVQPWSDAETLAVREPSETLIDPVAGDGLQEAERVGTGSSWGSLADIVDVNFVEPKQSTLGGQIARAVPRAAARETSESPLRSTYAIGEPSTTTRVGSAFSSYLPRMTASESQGPRENALGGNRVPAGRAELRVAGRRQIERGVAVLSNEPPYTAAHESWARTPSVPAPSTLPVPHENQYLEPTPGQSTRRRETSVSAWEQHPVSPTQYTEPVSDRVPNGSVVAPTAIPTTPLPPPVNGVQIEPFVPAVTTTRLPQTNTTSTSTSLPSAVDVGVTPYEHSQVSTTYDGSESAVVAARHDSLETSDGDTSDSRSVVPADPASMLLMHGTTPRTWSDESTHTLQDLLDSALQSHPQISEASAQVEVAQGLWVQAGLGPNPLVGFSGQQLGSNGQAEQIGLLIEQRVLRGNKLSLSQMVAAREVGQARQRLTLAVLSVEGRVSRAYVRAVIAQRRMRLVEQLTTMADENMRLTQLLVDSREASQVELLRARSQAQSIRAEYEAASRQWEGALSSLEAAVGTSLGDPDQPLSLDDPYPTGELDPLPDQLLSRLAGHPMIMEAELKADQARWKIQRETAQLYSDIDVQMVFQYDESTDAPNGILQVTGPLQIRDRNQGNIRAARGEMLEASRAVERKRLQLEQDFAIRVADYEEARARIKRFTEPEGILESSRQTVDLLRLGVQAGEEDLLALFLAERDRLNAELDYLDALEKGLDVQADLESLMVSGQP